MKRKVLVIAVVLMAVAMLAAPVMAKTKTEVKVIQLGGNVPGPDTKFNDTPNDRLHFAWNLVGTGIATLFEDDGVTVIDTFASSGVIDAKGKDSTTMGFFDGVGICHIKMLWTSNTVVGGFKGELQWRAIDGVATLRAVYQGFGYYEGQTLQLSGTWPPITLEGTLLS